MTLFNKFILVMAVFSLCILSVLIVSAGVFLTLLTVTTGAVLYYPLTTVEYLVSKIRRAPK